MPKETDESKIKNMIDPKIIHYLKVSLMKNLKNVGKKVM